MRQQLPVGVGPDDRMPPGSQEPKVRPAAVSPGHGSNRTSSVVCRSPALPARNS
ncbi:hypothetical protein ECMP0210175_5004 [Escherichia coli MP021017.5]|nr:hypothetical protein ECMP0210179_5089 [Escherichia coli MP021017.9]EMU72923.1 hypothetical protein ECMP0210176_5108 [Escherichia coli MP021017.6]EMU75070.1 hypothetical protein ECMP0210175_5004 [Escherichia coli MP021017.5]EMV01880.1 hypothetical protein ECMP0210174_5080 [Escherichia coli MP021017.4]EMV03042.1 hypothetical protein ECMP0210172_5121 [Escherichia coli MP021017.2]EMV07673.1 hypothetical protein ECMP02101712_4839 [Escherichia coli MP021017.12]EMV12838.1 hypothetical protein ECM